MIFYLTINDPPNGLYKSQVIDVVDFLNKEFNCQIKLIAFISFRGFWTNKKIINENFAESIVLPAFPKLQYFRYNLLPFIILLLCFRPNAVITRNVFANWLALKAKKMKLVKKVVYDGRGILKAEAEEYNVYSNVIARQIPILEKTALMNSDRIMAVTPNMVDYWKLEYGYIKKNFFVIPCTVGHSLLNEYNQKAVKELRMELNFSDENIVLVYSGSLALWQSINQMLIFFKHQLKNPKVKILLLCQENAILNKFEEENSGRVMRKWLNPNQVSKYLLASDYGIIMREKSITNSVSISTKFPEYLISGLKIIATDTMSISDFIHKNNLGFIIKNYEDSLNFERPTLEEKERVIKLAKENFLKTSPHNYSSYNEIIDFVKL